MGVFVFMDYSSLIQRPFYTARQNPATKSIDMSPLGDFWYSPARDSDDPEPMALLRSVPWLYRGVKMRSNAVAKMPFRIVRGESDFDTSDDYQNALGWLPDPRRMLYLTEAALTCYPAAYWWNGKNRITTADVRYVRPDTIEPKIDGDRGLIGFIRNVNGKRTEYPPEKFVYFWPPDPAVELGPAESSPVMAAIAASGVLYNLDAFAAAYFKRGAIKATLLTVSGAPIAAERDRLKNWWKDLVSGIKNAFATEIVNADSVTPVVIGEGLAELSNATLTAEKRQDIATALDIPMTMMFSESARGLGGGGVADADERKFYDSISTDCDLIADVINAQLLAPLGLRWEFLPETLDVYQEDENLRAAAFSSYVAAGLPLDVAGEMLGLELPNGVTWEQIMQRKEDEAQRMAEQMRQSSTQGSPDDGPPDGNTSGGNMANGNGSDPRRATRALNDLHAWRRKSNKRGKLADFESDHIPVAVMDEVKAHGENGWRDALDGMIVRYETTGAVDVAPAVDIAPLVEALKAATEALLNGHHPTE